MEIGIPLSALFAYAHNIKRDKEGHVLGFDTEFIPLPQFIDGVFYWYLMRERGFSHAWLAHAQKSTMIITANALMKVFPKK